MSLINYLKNRLGAKSLNKNSMDNELENQDSLNLEQGEDATPTPAPSDDELDKAKEYAKNQRIRAEKAEAELKRLRGQAEPKRPESETPKNEKYTLDDIDEISALSGVSKADRPWVLKIAKAEGKKPSEVLALGYVKTYLREQDEFRRTAEASNTGSGGRGATPESPEAIIAKVKTKGDPESPEEAEELARARMEEKLAKSKAKHGL